MVTALSLLTACGGNPKTTAEAEKIDYTVEQFADLQILRYRVPGFGNGFNNTLYFERRHGLWKLMQFEDLSD